MNASSNRTAYIHFGMAKTGTTSIQKTLYRHLAGSSETLHHVGLGFDSGAHTVINILFRSDTPTGMDLALRRYGLTRLELSKRQIELKEKLLRQIAQTGNRHAFFSSELIPKMSPKALREMHSYYTQNGMQPRALGYIRAPKSFMESAFQQNVQGGMGRFAVEAIFPLYQNRHEHIESVFGRENTEYWYFDPKTFKNGCVVQDFCARIGLEIQANEVIQRNESLSRPALALLYAYRKTYPSPQGKKPKEKQLIEKLQELPGEKFRFHSSLIAPLLEKHRSQIIWMEERLGTTLQEDLSKDDEHAVKSESDLLQFSPAALQWLSANVDDTHLAQAILTADPKQVGMGMKYLALKLARQENAWPKKLGRWLQQIGLRVLARKTA